MRNNNLINYIIRYHFFLLFIFFEFIAISLVVQNNNYQKSKVINIAHSLSGSIFRNTNKIKSYLHLKEINENLVLQNKKLKNELAEKNAILKLIPVSSISPDPLKQFEYTDAKIINNSTNKRHNYITLNKGEKQGIETEMAVISSNCILGVVNHVSENFSSVISILNPKLRISAKIKKNNYFGSLFWEGNDITTCILNEIPHHVEISLGDTIVTSGHSKIFPEGLMIGTIEDFKVKDGNFYEIKVKLAEDLQKVNNVLVIKNFLREEQLNLEKQNLDD